MCSFCGDPNHKTFGDNLEADPTGNGPVGTIGSTATAAIATESQGVIDTVPGGIGSGFSISIGGAVNGHASPETDQDWYAITLSAGTSYTFTLNGSGSNPLNDPYLRLFSASGTLIAQDDDSGPGLYSRLVYTPSTSGTYYLSAGAFIASSYDNVGQYTLAASAGGGSLPTYTLDQIADYLQVGYWGSARYYASTTITFNVNGLTSAGQTLARNALAAWADVSNLNFVETTGSAQITFDDNNSGAYASSTVSGGFITSSFVNVGTSWLSSYGTGTYSYSYQTYIHEIGHAIGFGHAGPYNGSATYGVDNIYANDSWAYTVMSYFDQAESGYGSFRFVMTPQLADIVAVQEYYGTPNDTRPGNTVYGHNSNAGALFSFSAYASAPAFTIFDSAGIDLLDVSGYSNAQIVDLRPASFSSIGGYTNNISIARNATIENAIGGPGNDTLIGNSADNSLAGGAGSDTLTGGPGADLLGGGANADWFVFDAAALTDALNGVHDRILDYSAAQGDRLNLTLILQSAFNSGQSAASLARLVSEPGGTYSTLQIDADGTGLGYDWVNLVRLDAIGAGGTVNALLSSAQPGGTSFTSHYGGTFPALQYTTFADPVDFNGDGMDDILLRCSDGRVGIWMMDGHQVQWGGAIATLNAAWNIQGTGDFNSDGMGDILLRCSDGRVGMWMMDGQQVQWGGTIATLNAEWNIIGTGDFNGDSMADILLRCSDGRVGMWMMNGQQVQGGGSIATLDAAWNIDGTGDFNGDGKSDILLRCDDGRIGIWMMNGHQVAWGGAVGSAGSDWQTLGTADFNDDGRSDILLRNNDGRVAIWEMNGAQVIWSGTIQHMSTDWRVAGVGDFSNDGNADILWRCNDGRVGVWGMDGHQLLWAGAIATINTEWQISGHQYDLV